MTEFNTTRAPSVSDLRELFAARPAVLSALNEAFKLSGGFYVRAARYESRYGSITVVANWGSALIELYGFEGDCPLRAYLSNFADFAE